MTPAWDEPDPAEVHHPETDDQWAVALGRYLGSFNDEPLLRCVQVARDHGARTVVVETRYLDLDYRSEFSAFYSKRFGDIPDTAHRLHFFRSELGDDELWSNAGQDDYIGYVSVRPSALGRVSRAMLPPPPGLASHVRCQVEEHINFFGTPLVATGVPFAQQDAELGACAHAAAWMCHYTAHLRGEAHRRAKAEFSLMANASLHAGRAVPTKGLTVHQLGDLFRQFGTPAVFYEVGKLDAADLPWQAPFTLPANPGDAPAGLWDTRLIPVLCRHLNSGHLPLVGTFNHAFVVVGYQRTTTADGQPWIEFLRHDDQAGPYLRVTNVLDDVDPDSGKRYGPWVTVQVPMPKKLWLTAVAAEIQGGQSIVGVSAGFARLGITPEDTPYLDLMNDGRFTVRTYAARSNDWKAALRDRADVVMQQEYGLARLPRYIWVVEAVDRSLRDAGQPCVLGEVVLDATSPEHDPEILAVNVHGVLWIQQTSGAERMVERPSASPYASGGAGPP